MAELSAKTAIWHIGRAIVEYVQCGEPRAEYGKEVIEALSRQILTPVSKGYSTRNLWYFRDFYLTYRDRAPSIRAERFRTSVAQNSKPVETAKMLHEVDAGPLRAPACDLAFVQRRTPAHVRRGVLSSLSSGNVGILLRMRGLPTVAVTLALMTPAPGFAAEYWVDPSAPMPGDGSRAAPFDAIDAALESAGAGDTVWLETGDYGELSISNLAPEERLTLAAAGAAEPRFSRVQLQDSANVTLRGLHVVGEAAGTLMDLDGEELVVEANVLMSAPDTADWSAQDWIDRASTGIEVSGTVNTVRDNYLLNVGYGISVSATHSLIEGNVIENFSRDGLRGLGDYTVFQYNTVKNCYAVDDHHDDGFQSWSVGDEGVGTGEVTGIVLRGNTIINYEDPNQPHRGTLQGIGCFDGTFVDWVIENNVVMTDHWHGITLLGARNCTVVNNTVIDLNDESPGPPWISVDDHKDGTPPVDCVVRNNLTTDLANSSAVTEEANIVLGMSELSDYFVDAAAHDLHLLEAAPAVDAGLEAAPALDRDRIPRPQGAGIDVGAYEWHEPSVGAEGGSSGAPNSNASTASSSASGTGAPGQGGVSGQGGMSGQGGTAARTSSAGSGPDSSATGSSNASGGSGGMAHDTGQNSGSSGSDFGAGGCGCRMLLPARLPASASALFLIVVSGLAWRRRGRVR